MEVKKVVSDLIGKMLDEDCTNPAGTAEKSADELLKRSIDCGREEQFKEAMKFWKRANGIPEEVLWQWFEGVFKGAKKIGKNSRKHKPGRGRRPPGKGKLPKRS